MELTVEEIRKLADNCFADYLDGRYTTIEFKRRVRLIIDLIPDSFVPKS